MLLLEDEKSGYQFFSNAYPGINSKSANGNSNIALELENISDDITTVVIADGAGFGAYIAKTMAAAREKRGY